MAKSPLEALKEKYMKDPDIIPAKGEDKELARQKALRSASTPGAEPPAAEPKKKTPRIGTQIKEDETLNEQLQEISKRWGFDK